MTDTVLIGWSVIASLLIALWCRQEQTKNATSVDVAWSLGISILVLMYTLGLSEQSFQSVLVGTLGFLWSTRLGFFLWKDRVLKHDAEDGRYAALRKHWGNKASFKFFWFYQAQGIVALLFSLPILSAMTSQSNRLSLILGVSIWTISVSGETIADNQLATFRSLKENQGKTCRVGLWRFSRHPNYFFEWLHWWTYVLLGQGAIITWLGPIIMFLLLFRLTGIPYTEIQAMKSRGNDYRDYQKTTSVFFPWFPRSKDS
jgi:steroid 5-alpha reductase family enzyme